MKTKNWIGLSLLLLLQACDSTPQLSLENVRLRRFGSCDEINQVLSLDRTVRAMPMGSETDQMAAPLGESNLQVAGVDELDRAKADGDFIYRISSENEVVVLRRSPVGDAGVIQSIATDAESSPLGILVTESHVILVSQRGGYGTCAGGSGAGDVCALIPPLLETSDPQIEIEYFARAGNGQLSSESKQGVDGFYVSSRMVNERLFLVSQVSQAVEVSIPFEGIDGSETPVTSCDRILFEPIAAADEISVGPSLNSLVCVLTFETSDISKAPKSECVLTDSGSTVYASAKNLFLATYGWNDTPIHQFELATDDYETRYVGSALASGYLLNSFSMDEFEGHLRVASTQWETSETPETVVTTPTNRVSVFEITGADLEESGSVEGMAPGETIYAVRFLGAQGFVVTFQQIDPLFTLDLSDPSDPRIVGELEVEGFSTYLHPMKEGYLFAIGREGWENLALSIFDVRDLANPQLVSRLTLSNAYSESEYNHLAFRYIPEWDLAILPVMEASGGGFKIIHASVVDGLSVAGESAFPDNTWDIYQGRSFFNDDRISLVGGGELVIRAAAEPDQDLAHVAAE